jgi:hypothetical protein
VIVFVGGKETDQRMRSIKERDGSASQYIQ